MQTTSPHLGVWLVTLGFITKRQLAQALEVEMVTRTPLDVVLRDKHMLTEATIEGACALQERLARASTPGDIPIEVDVLRLVPQHLAQRERLLPLARIEDRLVVGYARTRTRHDEVTRLLDQIGQSTGLLVHGIPFPEPELEKAIAQAYQPIAAQGLVTRAVQRVIPARQTTRAAVEVATAEEGEGPIIELANQLLTEAITRGASDMHLRPLERALEVTIRLDGVMHPLRTLPKEVESAVVSRLKVMADLNIAERRRPQDGRMSVKVEGQPIDLRVACIASHYGEMAVLRILRPLAMPEGFSSLGLEGPSLDRWERVVQAPNGLILVTGPTGSGKTSTLYATLNRFDRSERNLITVEDPVEYPVDGIGQIPIAPQSGLTFAAALRSILRLDPDVIMVGEIRDHETLMIALEAAQTGHLVLSTMHTNDAAAAIGRMAELGAPRYLIASTLVGVLAQRLVRRVCAQCGRAREATPEERALLGTAAALREGTGCEACSGVGYRGRLGVYEVLEVDPAVSDAIGQGASTQHLWRVANAAGMSAMIDDGLDKVRSGKTTIDEVRRVLGVRDLAPARDDV